MTFPFLNPDFPHHQWFPLSLFICLPRLPLHSHLRLFHCSTLSMPESQLTKGPNREALWEAYCWVKWSHYPSLHLHLPRFIHINHIHFSHLHEDGNSINWHWGGSDLIYVAERSKKNKKKKKPTSVPKLPKLPRLNSALALLWPGHMGLEPSHDLFWTECFVHFCADSVLGVRSYWTCKVSTHLIHLIQNTF